MGGKLRWLLGGAAIAAIAAPTGAVMAANSPLTAISNLAGTRTANVSAADQLLAAESDPRSAVDISGTTHNGNTTLLYTVPAKKALVLKTATETAFFQSTDTTADVAILVQSVTQNAYLSQRYFSRSAGLYQSAQVDFGSQIVIPSGGQVSLFGQGAQGGTEVYLYGYLVPASAASGAPSAALQAPPPAAVATLR